MYKYAITSLILALLTISCNNNTTSNAKSVASAPTTIETSLEKESKETMKIATTFMGAMGKGDMKTILNLMDDQMVWQNEGDNTLPWIGPWNSKKEILEKFMPLFGENFKTLKWNTEDAISSGNTAAFFGKMVGLTTKSNRKTKEFSFALRVKVKNGKIILWNWFEDSYEVSKAYHNTKN